MCGGTSDEGNEKKSLDYLNKKVKELKNPSNKILYDIGNIYKSFKKYNPHLRRGITPPRFSSYEVWLPLKNGETLLLNKEKLS